MPRLKSLLKKVIHNSRARKHPSVAEAAGHFAVFAARVNSCPFKAETSSASCDVVPIQGATILGNFLV
jgi:hypothetical protein